MAPHHTVGSELFLITKPLAIRLCGRTHPRTLATTSYQGRLALYQDRLVSHQRSTRFVSGPDFIRAKVQ
jgi:hypothetical protein